MITLQFLRGHRVLRQVGSRGRAYNQINITKITSSKSEERSVEKLVINSALTRTLILVPWNVITLKRLISFTSDYIKWLSLYLVKVYNNNAYLFYYKSVDNDNSVATFMATLMIEVLPVPS